MCTEYISMDEHNIHGVVGYKNISSNTLAAEYIVNGILKEKQIKLDFQAFKWTKKLYHWVELSLAKTSGEYLKRMKIPSLYCVFCCWENPSLFKLFQFLLKESFLLRTFSIWIRNIPHTVQQRQYKMESISIDRILAPLSQCFTIFPFIHVMFVYNTRKNEFILLHLIDKRKNTYRVSESAET